MKQNSIQIQRVSPRTCERPSKCR